MKIRFVRVWYDHCMKRMPCPWTVQVQYEGQLKTFECYSFWFDFNGTVCGALTVEQLDPPTIQHFGVTSVRITPYRGDAGRVVAQSE